MLTHTLDVVFVCARLRHHASRALREKGYKTNMSRRDHAHALRALAKKIEERQHLHLSTRWWIDKARAQLDTYDKDNPMR